MAKKRAWKIKLPLAKPPSRTRLPPSRATYANTTRSVLRDTSAATKPEPADVSRNQAATMNHHTMTKPRVAEPLQIRSTTRALSDAKSPSLRRRPPRSHLRRKKLPGEDANTPTLQESSTSVPNRTVGHRDRNRCPLRQCDSHHGTCKKPDQTDPREATTVDENATSRKGSVFFIVIWPCSMKKKGLKSKRETKG